MLGLTRVRSRKGSTTEIGKDHNFAIHCSARMSDALEVMQHPWLGRTGGQT